MCSHIRIKRYKTLRFTSLLYSSQREFIVKSNLVFTQKKVTTNSNRRITNRKADYLFNLKGVPSPGTVIIKGHQMAYR